MGSAHALADALTACWIEVDGASVQDIQELIARRAPLLSQIAELDPSTLDAGARATLTEALELARARDAALVAALAGERDRTAAALGELRHARTAARGYRGAPRSRVGSVLKTA